jgi:hypothetical protein
MRFRLACIACIQFSCACPSLADASGLASVGRDARLRPYATQVVADFTIESRISEIGGVSGRAVSKESLEARKGR